MSALDGTVLVTGGAGFIGSHLVEHLANRGVSVRVLDNFRNGRRENLVFPGAEAVEVIDGDILDEATCARAMRGVTAVFHLACLGVRHSLHAPVENHQVNALGTLNVLEAARAEEVRPVRLRLHLGDLRTGARLPDHRERHPVAADRLRQQQAGRRALRAVVPRVLAAAGRVRAAVQQLRPALALRGRLAARSSRASCCAR